MARTKYPPLKAIGVRPNGLTPPEKMTPEERMKYSTEISIIAAESIGGVPKKQDKPELRKTAD